MRYYIMKDDEKVRRGRCYFCRKRFRRGYRCVFYSYAVVGPAGDGHVCFTCYANPFREGEWNGLR